MSSLPWSCRSSHQVAPASISGPMKTRGGWVPGAGATEDDLERLVLPVLGHCRTYATSSRTSSVDGT